MRYAGYAVLGLIACGATLFLSDFAAGFSRRWVSEGTTTGNEDCRACHDGDEGGRTEGGTYGQWRASPYGTRDGGLTCAACHLRSAEDSRCLRSMGDGSPGLSTVSREAASIVLVTSQVDRTVEVEVSVSNLGTGHFLPSGTTDVVMFLQVEATASDGSQIEASSGPRLPPGVGANSGRRGWIYGLRPHEDTRLEPFATHRSRYRFQVAASEKQTVVVASLQLCESLHDTTPQCRTVTTADRGIRW